MVDKYALGLDEYILVDTSSNIVAVVCCRGKAQIADENWTFVADLAEGEIFTLSANTGKFRVIGKDIAGSTVYVFRMFYI